MNFRPGFYPIGQFVEQIIGGLVAFLAFAIGVAVLFLLVRFLLVATKAAQVYVDKNQAVAVAVAGPAAVGPAVVVPPAVVPPSAAPAAAKPPTRKTPPKK